MATTACVTNCFRCPSFSTQRVKPDRRGLRRPQPERAVIIYAGIDGTSTETDTYERTYYNSFVNRLHRNELLPFDDTWYLRGPYLSGFDTDKRARACHTWVRDYWKSGKVKAIFLGGHSRGGAAVIEVASWLAEEQIPVECLVLYDAVDRTNTLGGDVWNTPIAPTVKRVIYPQRDVLLTCSRLSFGNCGFRHQASTTFLHQKFFATHSGIGGVPWPKAVLPGTELPNPTGLIWEPGEIKSSHVTPARDAAGSQQVWSWSSGHLAFAYKLCKDRLAREGNGQPGFQVPAQPGTPAHLPPTGKPRIHVVVAGDWLSKIALKYYGDAMKYPVIHRANLAVIGPDPNLIKPGQRLVIP